MISTLPPLGKAWGLDGPKVAERIVADGQMDVVMMARAHLANPHYPYRLAQELGVDAPTSAKVLPVPYEYWLAKYRGPSA